MLTIQSLSYELCGYSTYNVKYTDEHGHLGIIVEYIIYVMDITTVK